MSRVSIGWLAFAACSGGGSSTLIRVTDEVAGLRCAAGGVKIDTGVDDDGSGELSDDEVDTTSFLCNGESHASPLVLIADEAPGTNCLYGGQRIDYGLDDNDSGTLDPDEIDGTAYICNGIDNSCLVDLDCGGAVGSCDPVFGQCRYQLIVQSQGTMTWPDQACPPDYTFGACDSNADAESSDWATAVCVRNGWDRGEWTGAKRAGCGNNAALGEYAMSMFCSESLPCEPTFEYTCDPMDQTVVDIHCFR